MNKAEQTSAFCSALLGGPDDDRLSGLYVTLWTPGDRKTRWCPADQPGTILSSVAELDADPRSEAVYISTTLSDDTTFRRATPQKPREYLRPLTEECAGLVALWVEIDILGEGHASSHLPKTEEQARKILDEMRLPPTMVVHSGGGLHAWWVLTEPWLVREAEDPKAERVAMHQLVTNWISTARHHAERLGRWKVDTTTDLARLLRPAGTTNRKIEGQPRAVRLVEYHPERTYDPSDFDEYMPDASVLAAYASPDNSSARLSPEQLELLDGVNLAAVWARVASPEYRAIDYTPEWLAEILAIEAENGENLIARTWNGQRETGPKGFKGDPSRYDWALVQLLSGIDGVDTEALVEAVMCRRLRSGDNTDKVNPQKRRDYVARTVAKFRHDQQVQEERQRRAEEHVSALAGLALDTPPLHAVPEVDEESADEDPEAEFARFTQGLIEDEPPADEEYQQAATKAVSGLPEDVPDVEPEPKFFTDDRPAIEVQCLDQLTELLIPAQYRHRGVEVWRLEVRDSGDQQKGRILLRLPLDFEWPTDRPRSYLPGRPLPTEWVRRDAFERALGFQRAIERDAKIIARDDAPAADWSACIRELVPMWRADSTGGDFADFAHVWLYGYLMERQGSTDVTEVTMLGRPWVRKHNGWSAKTPPVIYIDLAQFLEYCSHQRGAVNAQRQRDLVERLRLTKRRPRLPVTGVHTQRPTWYEIEPTQFGTDEWEAIINVLRFACEKSALKRGLRVVEDGSDRGAVSLDGEPARKRGVR